MLFPLPFIAEHLTCASSMVNKVRPFHLLKTYTLTLRLVLFGFLDSYSGIRLFSYFRPRGTVRIPAALTMTLSSCFKTDTICLGREEDLE